MLKYLFYLCIIASLMMSCSVFEPSTIIHTIDFRNFTEKNFLISPYQYNGDFESLGLVYGYFTPGFEEQERAITYMPTKKEAARGIEPTYEYNVQRKNFNLTEMVTKLYLKAIEMGGDAIVDFKWDIVPNENDTSSMDIEWGYTVTMEGFVIKRK